MSVSEQLTLDISRALYCDEIFYINAELLLPNSVLPYADANFVGAVSVVGEYNRFGSDIEVICDVSFTIEALCDKCAQKSKQSFNFEVDEIFVQNSDLDSYCYNGHRLHLTQAIVDNILSNLPTAFVCNAQCKGLCPVCGVNLNISSCNCNR